MPGRLTSLVALFLAGCSQPSGSPDLARERAAVRAADSAWLRAVEANSVDQVQRFYDPEALTAGPSMFPGRGAQAVAAGWAPFFSQPGFRLTWQVDSVDVVGSGNLAYSIGRWHQLAPVDSSGPYFAVWRKQADGTWKVLIDAGW